MVTRLPENTDADALRGLESTQRSAQAHTGATPLGRATLPPESGRVYDFADESRVSSEGLLMFLR